MAKNNGFFLLLAAGAACWYFCRKPNGLSPVADPVTPSLALNATAADAHAAVQGDSSTLNNLVSVNSPSSFVNDPGVLSWAKQALSALNFGQFNKVKSSFSGSDWAGLADLVDSHWSAGVSPSQTNTAFWNRWRSQYHINDGTFK